MDDISIVIHSKLEYKYQLTNLLESIRQNNKDNIPVYLIVFNGEQGEFSWASQYVKGIYEEASIFESKLKYRPLKIQSMLLNLHKSNLSRNYVILSSLCIFNRPFSKHTFMETFLEPDESRPKYFAQGLANCPELETTGFKSPKYMSSAYPRVWSSQVLQFIEEKIHPINTDSYIAWLQSKTDATFNDCALYSAAFEELFPNYNLYVPLFPKYGDKLSDVPETYQNQLNNRFT